MRLLSFKKYINSLFKAVQLARLLQKGSLFFVNFFRIFKSDNQRVMFLMCLYLKIFYTIMQPFLKLARLC